MELRMLVFQLQTVVWFGSLFMVTNGVPPSWSEWEVWTKCSRQCDWGVSLQKRRCLQGACQGPEKRYRTCKITDCPVGTPDFRAQQCALSNDEKHTDGKMYHWVPVENLPVDQQCTLTCRAAGESITKVLSPKVLDGTRCSPHSIDMCILGRCEPVGCDHQLNSTAAVDMCGVCNGDNSTCKLMKGKSQAEPSASDAGPTKDLFTIPRGSTLIRLTSKGPHSLGLVSRQRGNTSPAQRPGWTQSGEYWVGDNTVKYTRLKSGREHAYIQGPLADPISVYVYFNRLESKPETVHYRFSAPLQYGWSHAWSECSVTCGRGEQQKVYVCVNLATGQNVPESNCEQNRPQHERRPCNRRICPPQWQPEPWQPCSRTCSGGKQTRNVYCVRRALNNMMMRVEDDMCSGSKPNDQQNCNLEPCPHWMTGQWSQCSVTCGQGTKQRTVSCLNSQRESSMGCNPLQRPALSKTCIVGVPCVRGPESLPPRIVIPDGNWNQPLYHQAQRNRSTEPSFEATEWGPCSVTCGQGTRTRSVRCKVYLQSTRMVQDLPDAHCGRQAKPADTARCEREDCPPPGSREGDNTVPDGGYPGGPLQVQFVWRYTGFTECSASCIGGLQESLVQCVHIDGETPVSDTLCDITSRPTTYTRVCNQQACPPKWEVVLYKECSATCGGGSQFPLEVLCMRTNARGVGNTDVLPDTDCEDIPVPSDPVPCGLLDCPAYWQTGPWSECTQSCGGGLRTRELTCTKRMGTGEDAVVDWHQCPFTAPASTETCNSWACTALHEWMPQDWSECSVTCGVGMMVRPITCARHEPDGTTTLVDFNHCPEENQPDHSQICQLAPCSEPEIMGNMTTYRQTDFSNKKRLVVGMTAYVMRGVTITVRCPVRNFKKSRIQWQRGPVPISPDDRRAKVLKEGTLRIRGVKTADQGVYTCVAGPATERFILHVKDIKGRSGPSLFDVRWIIGNWSECSASCGGGVQQRSVICQQGSILGRSGARNLKRACRALGLGSPEEEQACNTHPCKPHWASQDWAECTLACTGPALGTQLRHVYCEGSRRERLADSQCDAAGRPSPHRACHHTGCTPVWKEADWSRCSATCGNQGIQMRTIQCAYSGTGALASPLTCAGLKQPVLTQRCANMPDCPADDCQDSIKFCSLVKRMNKCHLDAYKSSCCRTCS